MLHRIETTVSHIVPVKVDPVPIIALYHPFNSYVHFIHNPGRGM